MQLTTESNVMTPSDIQEIARYIVAEARQVSRAHTDQPDAPVNYVCVFAQSVDEYEDLLTSTHELGTVVAETPTGPVFQIDPVSTAAGPVQILKIRKPDPKRLERGDADFTVSDYDAFKKSHLDRPGFSLIKRPEMEMIELVDPRFNALAYFSHPVFAKTVGIDLDLPAAG